MDRQDINSTTNAISKNEIMIIDEQSLREKTHFIRGQKVMLDRDLAEIYGYETKNFNRQVRNNMRRFEGDDFMFQLSKEEFDNLRCKNFTTSWGGPRYLPYVFTEQGIYLLMTVLKGDLAVRQSRTLIRLFKSMKDHLIKDQPLLMHEKYYSLVETVEKHSLGLNTAIKDIQDIRDSMVTKADLSDFMKLFDTETEHEEVLILDGEPFKADVAYQKIYENGKCNILIIDDYIGVKTLDHLAHAKTNVALTVISDNKARPPLKQVEYIDFIAENPSRNITFLQSCGRVHDRYIVLDEGTKDMKVFHCGASSKDAGKKITTITIIAGIDDYKKTISVLLCNPPLVLR